MPKSEEVHMCDMRGMLSFTILWLLSKRSMYGQELATEIGKRRGEKPNPGTIYPALKDLASHGLIEARIEGRSSVYQLTKEGAVLRDAYQLTTFLKRYDVAPRVTKAIPAITPTAASTSPAEK